MTEKTLLYRLFGWGKIPKRLRPVLEGEGIALVDEGIGGSVTMRNFRAPGRRYSWRRTWFSGSLVLTEKRFWAFAFSKPLISVPLDDDSMAQLHCGLLDNGNLGIRFDVAAFHDGWKGTIECRFATDRASIFLDKVLASGATAELKSG